MNNLPTVISYDLTSAEGMANALADYAKKNPSQTLMMAAFPLLAPIVMIGTAIGEKVSKSASALSEHSKNTIDSQRKAAIDIIKAGKDNGASKVRVTLNQKAGIDIGGSLEGYSLKFDVGSDDSMTIEVEYA